MIAAEVKVYSKTTRIAVTEDLSLKSYTRISRHHLVVSLRRLDWCMEVLG